jgi:peptidyl-prolyl cis-trans isomerase B (cyclophilin B)
VLFAVPTGCGVLEQDNEDPAPTGWEERAASIDDIVNYRETDPDMLTTDHTDGRVTYEVLPPVGGDHAQQWQNCQGEVYVEPVLNENAVHSLEHGAVWVTHEPDLAADQVRALADRVRGNEKSFMSPYPALDRPISLQAWGYQLKVDDAGDPRIDEFIEALRVNASLEGPNARCDGGVGGVTEAVAATSPGPCVWTEAPDHVVIVDVGEPPAGEPREGTRLMTVATNLGDLVVEMDLAASPCTAASFTHLAGHEVFDGSKCHRMFPGMLQCGDPTVRGEGYRDSDGEGGPSYQFADENLPVGQTPAYPAGTVALANRGPNTNGSQFFFVYQDMDLDGPNYGVVGTVVEGLEVLQQVDAIGHDGAFDTTVGGGHPNQDIVVESLRVSDPT